MASNNKKTASVLQAQAYLKDLGYTNPDSSEIQGAISDLNSDPETFAKYANVGGETKTGTTDTSKLDEVWTSAAKTGISREQFNALNPTQQATIAAAGDVFGTLYASGATGVTLDEALRRAASDPAIVSKYSDSLNLDKNLFTQNLVTLQNSVSDEVTKNRIQFQKDKAALDEAAATAGTAYSGFRNKAKDNLQQTETGIVTSSRSKAQSDLDSLKTNFAAKYGSAATPAASLIFSDPRAKAGAAPQQTITPNVPSVIGSDIPAKSNDINSLGKSFYDNAQLPTI